MRKQACTVSSKRSNRVASEGNGQAEAQRLLGIVARPDREHRAAARKHVEGRDHLRQQSGMPIRNRGGQREEAHPARVGGDEAERRVRLDLAYFRPSHDGVLPEVIGHVDAGEARGFRGFNHLG